MKVGSVFVCFLFQCCALHKPSSVPLGPVIQRPCAIADSLQFTVVCSTYSRILTVFTCNICQQCVDLCFSVIGYSEHNVFCVKIFSVLGSSLSDVFVCGSAAVMPLYLPCTLRYFKCMCIPILCSAFIIRTVCKLESRR